MNDPIEIKIAKTENEVSSGGVQAKPDIKADPAKPDLKTQAVNAAIINAGKNVAMQGVRAMGDITGDYAMTNTIDTTLSIGADVLMIAAGGPVGVIAVGAKYTTQFINQQAALYNSNQEINRQRARMGVVISRGSRYGGE